MKGFRKPLKDIDGLLSSELYPLEREQLYDLGYLDFPSLWGRDEPFEDICTKVREHFIPEHLGDDGKFSQPLADFHSYLRRVVREHGIDVRPQTLFDEPQWQAVIRAVESNSTEPLRNIEGLYCETNDDLRLRGHTPLGKLAGWLATHCYSRSDLDCPLNSLQPGWFPAWMSEIVAIRGQLSELASYDSIIRRLYDMTEGFLFISPEYLEAGRVAFGRLNIFPAYFARQYESPPSQLQELESELIARDYMTRNQADCLRRYTRDKLNGAFRRVQDRLYVFPFTIAQLTRIYWEATVNKYLTMTTTTKCFADRDLHTILDNNPLAFCLFYDYVFDGPRHLRQTLKAQRPDHKAANSLLVWLVGLLNKEDDMRKRLPLPCFNRVSTPLNVAHDYVQWLTGHDIKKPINTYQYWKSRVARPPWDDR